MDFANIEHVDCTHLSLVDFLNNNLVLFIVFIRQSSKWKQTVYTCRNSSQKSTMKRFSLKSLHILEVTVSVFIILKTKIYVGLFFVFHVKRKAKEAPRHFFKKGNNTFSLLHVEKGTSQITKWTPSQRNVGREEIKALLCFDLTSPRGICSAKF